MNGVDYSKRLDRERESYQKSIQDNNRNNKERIEVLESSFDHKTKSQQEAYAKQRSNLEETYKDRYSKLDQSQKEALSEKHKVYEDTINADRDRFHESSRKNLKEFNQKFSDLKSTTDRNQEQREETDNTIRKQQSENYEKRVAEIRNNSDKSLKAYQENAIGGSQEVNEKFQTEKRNLVSDHEKDLNSLQRSEIEKRNILKDKVIKDVNRIRETQEAETTASRQRAKDSFKDLTAKSEEKISIMQEKLNNESDRLNETQQKEIKTQNQAFTERFTDQEKSYNRSLREIELKNRLGGTGAGSANAEIAKKQKLAEAEAVDRRVASVLDERQNVEVSYAKKFDVANQDFKDTYKDMRLEHTEDLENAKRAFTEENRAERTKARLDKANANFARETALEYNNKANQIKLDDNLQQTRTIVDKLKENYNKSMNQAVSNSQGNFALAREEANSEKRDLEKKLHEQNSANTSQIKTEYDLKISKIREGYEQRINSLENQNKEMQQNYEIKIRDISNKTQDEVSRQQKALRASTESEIKVEREAASSREKQLRESLRLGQMNFDRKLNELRLESTSKINEITFDYEKKLKDQEEKFSAIVDTNKKFSDREAQRLQMASTSERDRLISQYEDRIDKLQEVNRQKLLEMEKFAQMNIG